MLRVAGQVARHSFSLARLLIALVLGLTVLLAVGAVGLAWRLSQGPMHLPWAARLLESAVNDPGAPTRLVVGDLSLTWEGFSLGVDRPLDLRLRDARVVGADGVPVASVAQADLSLALAPLLLGHVSPRALRVDAPRLRILRAADGATTLDIGSLAEAADAADANGAEGAKPGAVSGPDLLSRLLADLGHPAEGASGTRGTGRLRFGQLRRVEVQDAALTVQDRQLGLTWRVPRATLDLRRQAKGGVDGVLQAAISAGGTGAELSARASLLPDGDGTRLEARMTPVNPAALATRLSNQAPAAAVLAALDLPIAVTAQAELGPQFGLRHFAVTAQATSGQVRAGGTRSAIASAELVAEGDLGSVQLQKLRVALQAPGAGPPPAVTVTGTAARAQGGLRIQAHLGVDRVAFADLPVLWPAPAAPDVRSWIVENIPAGTARNGAFDVTLEAAEDFSRLKVAAAAGHLDGEDLSVHWLRPVPPIEHGQARLIVVSPDVIDVAVSGGNVGKLQLRNGLVHITGVSVKDQDLAVTGDVAGPLADVIELLRHPRLHLLDKRPVTMRNPAGTVAVRLDIRFPLEKKLTVERVAIRAQSRLTDVHLGGIVAGRDLDHGMLDLDLDPDGMRISGRANVAAVPSELKVALDFRDGPPSQVVTQVDAKGRATEKQLDAAGIDTLSMIEGPAALEVAYAQRRDGHADLNVHADLRDAELNAGALNWRKPPGQPASASARLRIDHDHIFSAEEIHADAPGLSLQGRSEFAEGKPQNLRIERGQLGRSDTTGLVAFPTAHGEPIRATLSGRQIDLSNWTGKGGGGTHPAAPASAPPAKSADASSGGTPWSLQARWDRAIVAGDRGVAGFSVIAESDGRTVRQANIRAGAPVGLSATITPDRSGRGVLVTAEDAGALLRTAGITDAVAGGRMNLAGRFEDSQPDHPFAGTLDAEAFRIKEVPAAAKVVEAMSLYGVLGALRGPGLDVSRLIAPFTLVRDVLHLGEARAFSPALGVTAHGTVDLARKAADLQGTIVPAYMVNSFLGNIPLLGRLFSPERGGGLFAATFTLRGRLENPNVTINPLAALTPGFLRGLFGIFEQPAAR